MNLLLDYWFGSLDHTPDYFRERNKLWFMAGKKIDAEITERFGALLESAARGELREWEKSPKGLLALLLLLDQVSLSVYRNARDGYELGDRAVPLAQRMLERGWQETLSPAERIFTILPFEHSETLADQERSVGLFTTLALSAPPELRPIMDDYLDYALRHRRVVQRFGRFPHRNEALGRKSSAEELAFLASRDAPF